MQNIYHQLCNSVMMHDECTTIMFPSDMADSNGKRAYDCRLSDRVTVIVPNVFGARFVSFGKLQGGRALSTCYPYGNVDGRWQRRRCYERMGGTSLVDGVAGT